MKRRPVTFALALLLASSAALARPTAPRQVCYTEYVPRPVLMQYGGALLGGAAGAFAGSKLGQGTGNQAAIAAGAIAGALLGNHLQDRYSGNVQAVSRCEPAHTGARSTRVVYR
jgi:uncharacterized protein YcfJ